MGAIASGPNVCAKVASSVDVMVENFQKVFQFCINQHTPAVFYALATLKLSLSLLMGSEGPAGDLPKDREDRLTVAAPRLCYCARS